MIPQTWSINALSVELAIDRRVLSRRLEGLVPVSETTVGKRKDRQYRLADVIAHLFDRQGEQLDLNQERARLAVLQQQKLELEIAELRGVLIRTEAVQDRWNELVAAVRAKMLALPSKIAVAVASPDRLQAAEDRASGLIHEALAELAAEGSAT